MTTRSPFDLTNLAMAASLAVAGLMLVGKLGAYWLTGSQAILSDAAESVVHIAATAFAAYGLWFSRQPADPDHPYGHGKFAYFSAGFEGALILTAAVSIVVLAVRALLEGPTVHALGWGLVITGGLAAVNLALGLFLIHVGRTRRTLVLVANGHHVLTDMWTSVGVVVGVAAVWLTGWVWLDPVVAIGAALNILRAAFGLLRESYHGLMDRADSEETARIVGVLQGAIAEGRISTYHQLRHRRVGDQVWIDLHLLFPGGATITQAHDAASRVEHDLHALFPGDRVAVISHLEPDEAEHEAVHPGGHEEFPDPLA